MDLRRERTGILTCSKTPELERASDCHAGSAIEVQYTFERIAGGARRPRGPALFSLALAVRVRHRHHRTQVHR